MSAAKSPQGAGSGKPGKPAGAGKPVKPSSPTGARPAQGDKGAKGNKDGKGASDAKDKPRAPRPAVKPVPPPVPVPGPPPGVVLEPYQVILRPLVTEKGMHRSTRYNQYSFEVSPLAGKSDVRNAVETLFDVTVVKVRTQYRRGKHRRYRFRQGITKDWKKAVVTIAADQRIELF